MNTEIIKQAFTLGFSISREGFNAECYVPEHCKGLNQSLGHDITNDETFQECLSKCLEIINEQNKNTETKYHLFAGDVYYPLGGAGDYRATSESIEDLKKMYEENIRKWAGSSRVWGQICNAETMEIIEEL